MFIMVTVNIGAPYILYITMAESIYSAIIFWVGIMYSMAFAMLWFFPFFKTASRKELSLWQWLINKEK
jgi:hypothetical protein